MFPDDCLICPTTNDAKTIASWVKRQGDGRGLWWHEPYEPTSNLLIFDSYGATHTTAVQFFKLRNVDESFILQKNGDYHNCDMWVKPQSLDRYFSSDPTSLKLFTLIAKYLGNPSPIAKSCD